MAAQDHIQLGFEYVHWWRLHNPSGKPVPVFNHLDRNATEGSKALTTSARGAGAFPAHAAERARSTWQFLAPLHSSEWT